MPEFIYKLKRFMHNLFIPTTSLMNLWVDDIRPAPKGWYWVGTEDEMFDFLLAHNVDKWSLDHDLGPGGEVYRVLVRICEAQENGGISLWPLQPPTLHTANPVGRDNMKAIIERYGPYTPPYKLRILT